MVVSKFINQQELIGCLSNLTIYIIRLTLNTDSVFNHFNAPIFIGSARTYADWVWHSLNFGELWVRICQSFELLKKKTFLSLCSFLAECFQFFYQPISKWQFQVRPPGLITLVVTLTLTDLRAQDHAFVRQGFSLEKTLSKPENREELKCKVTQWSDLSGFVSNLRQTMDENLKNTEWNTCRIST